MMAYVREFREKRAWFVFPVHDNTRREARPDTGAWYSGTQRGDATSFPLFPHMGNVCATVHQIMVWYGLHASSVRMRACLMHVYARPLARLARRA